MRFILGWRSKTNKTHIGWRPKWLAIQIGALPNWRRRAETSRRVRCTVRRVVEAFVGLLSAYCFQTGNAERPGSPIAAAQWALEDAARGSAMGQNGVEQNGVEQRGHHAFVATRGNDNVSAYLPECRADGMADVRDLKSRGDFPRVGSTPTPGTTPLFLLCSVSIRSENRQCLWAFRRAPRAGFHSAVKASAAAAAGADTALNEGCCRAAISASGQFGDR